MVSGRGGCYAAGVRWIGPVLCLLGLACAAGDAVRPVPRGAAPGVSPASRVRAQPPIAGATTPDALVVRAMGAGGFALRVDGHRILLDPRVTEPSAWARTAGRLASDSAARARVPPAQALVVGQTDWRHFLDVPALAMDTGAVILGGPACVQLLAGAWRARGVSCRPARGPQRSGPFLLVPVHLSEAALGHHHRAPGMSPPKALRPLALAANPPGRYVARGFSIWLVRAAGLSVAYFSRPRLPPDPFRLPALAPGGVDLVIVPPPGGATDAAFIRGLVAQLAPRMILGRADAVAAWQAYEKLFAGFRGTVLPLESDRTFRVDAVRRAPRIRLRDVLGPAP